MDNAALFRVRTEAAERVRQAMEKHKLPKDSVGGYRYNDAVTFIENVEGVLEDEYFENANDGMRGLVNLLPNELTSFKANVAITRADVKRQSIADAPGGDATKAEITSNEDAQEEANRQNVFRLACIGAKESMAKEITARVGNSITNTILRHPDGIRMKKVDEYQLHELIAAVREGAARPDPIEIRRQIAAIMDTVFDWRETAATNQERLSADIAKADAFGIEIRNDIKGIVILANVAAAARFSSGGTEIREAQRKIKAAYAYNRAHDDASIKVIMTLLAAADEQRDRTTAPAPTDMANMVTDRLRELVTEDYSSSDGESAMGATSGSGSSTDRSPRRERPTRRVASRRAKGRRAARSSTSPTPSRSTRGKYESPPRRRSPSPAKVGGRGRYESPPKGRSSSRARKKLAPHEVNPTNCKWCKKWGGNGLAHGSPNNIPHAKCNYNEDWDGWRPRYVCRRMDVAYKEREECDE